MHLRKYKHVVYQLRLEGRSRLLCDVGPVGSYLEVKNKHMGKYIQYTNVTEDHRLVEMNILNIQKKRSLCDGARKQWDEETEYRAQMDFQIETGKTSLRVWAEGRDTG